MSEQMNKTQIDIEALEEARRQAMDKIHELDSIIALAKQQLAESQQNEVQQIAEPEVAEVTEKEQPKANVFESKPKKEEVEVAQPAAEVKEEVKRNKKEQKELQKQDQRRQEREKEKLQLQALAKSIANRTKGRLKAEPGNTKMRYTNNEVFIFVVDDNELQLKVMQEQFKNSRSFKITKGFSSGAELLKYLKTYKFPKNSIFVVVMDYFLEKANEEDAQNGIEVMRKIKEYDPDIEVIMLSGSAEVDIAASAAHFGAVSFIQKGPTAMKKVFENIVWIIKEKDKIRKRADSKAILRTAIITFIVVMLSLLVIDYFLGGKLGIADFLINNNDAMPVPPPAQ